MRVENQAYPFRAPYSPAALRAFGHATEPSPTLQEISEHRFAMRQGVRKDNMEQLDRDRLLHDHFSIDTRDRSFAHHEGLMDIHDAVSALMQIYVVFSHFSTGYGHGTRRRHPVHRVCCSARMGSRETVT